ncbi:MAG: ATP-binding protein [Patescibacteria group bacterium]|nr:ATP-binding protein [Patescibacteria group bacterium]
MSAGAEKKLHLSFHGRIIDSLGIQMYQSPVAAVAELIANAWDADATWVDVTLPADNSSSAELVVKDNGAGMTFAECQDRYLNVGRNRRLADGERTPGGRPLLGRKGIGKFAGFGIARIVEIETVSAASGERTVFALDLQKLRSDEFVSDSRKEIDLLVAEDADETRKGVCGTTIRLRSLVYGRRPDAASFVHSMARRFVLAQQAAKFRVQINGLDLPEEADPIGNKTEFVFPAAYDAGEAPAGLQLTADGWGRETVADGEVIDWQIKFTEKPIGEEELRGVAVYCGVKLAQAPFFFLLSGGLAGQHGQQYMTGRVRADYLDRMDADIITTERQRINWEEDTASRLLDWGQGRLKQLLALWQHRRAEAKMRIVEARLANFSRRIDRLKPSEAKIVKRALLRIASIAAIDQPQFEDLAGAVLTAWEGGRLRDIIEQVSRIETMDANILVSVLSEHQVLTALHVAEAVKLKLEVVDGLRRRIAARELENAVRDYIAANPWLISPQWETFQVERRIANLVQDALQSSGINTDIDWNGRVDLVLSSGAQLLVLEFMRPGLTVDRNHIDRFQRYIDILRARVRVNTELGFRDITGQLVADRLHRNPEDQIAIDRMAANGMYCSEWSVLLDKAEAQWKDFLFALAARAPNDDRVRALTESATAEAEDLEATDLE